MVEFTLQCPHYLDFRSSATEFSYYLKLRMLIPQNAYRSVACYLGSDSHSFILTRFSKAEVNIICGNGCGSARQ